MSPARRGLVSRGMSKSAMACFRNLCVVKMPTRLAVLKLSACGSMLPPYCNFNVNVKWSMNNERCNGTVQWSHSTLSIEHLHLHGSLFMDHLPFTLKGLRDVK